MSARRYRFGPLEQRGVVGPLRIGQVAVVAVAALLALAAMYGFRSWAGMLVALAVLGAAGAAIYLPFEGRTLEEWAPVGLRWAFRSSPQKRGYRSGSPSGGVRIGTDGEAVFASSLPPELSGLRMLEVPYGSEQVGVLHDRRAGTYTAALAVRAGAFGLLDQAEQERKLDAWGSVVASMARDGSPVRRLQWIEQTLPASGDEPAAYLQAERDRAVPLDSGLVTSYIELIESATPVSQEHEILLALQISERRASREMRRLGGGIEAACELLMREVENLAERLSIAEITVFGLLRPSRYAAAIRDAFDPYGRLSRTRAGLGSEREGTDPALMGPMADREEWSSYRSDSAHHITAWISSWPRTDVGPAFLTPLLMQTTACRTVSVVIEPVPHSTAIRKAEAARTAEVAEEMQRERQGFLTSARIRRRQQAAARREEELADGHAEVIFTGYFGVHGRGGEEAERHYSDGEHSGALARLEFQRMYGEQEAAFMNLLPICRGIEVIRGRRRWGERPGHNATTAHFQALYPFLAEGGLGSPGVYIGRDACGGAWVFDPWRAYEAGSLPGPNMLVVGQLSRGKSAFLKTYIARQAIFGRQASVLDPKGEFAPLADFLGGTVIRLVPGGEVRLNPISSRMGREGQLSLLRSVAAAALRRELTPEEDAGLRVALRVVSAAELDEPTLPEVVAALLHPTAAMTSEVVMDAGDFATATRQVALALQRLCEGDLRGMFDGPTSRGLNLDASFVALDLSAVQDSSALGILMTCAAAWLQGVVLERKRAAEAREGDPPKVILAVDEAWRISADLGVAEWLQRSFKLSRAHGVQNIIALHRSDLGAAGAAGSREARIAEGLISDADTKVILAQPPDQIDGLRGLLGLSATEAELVPTLRRGEALWQVGPRSFLVQHRLSSIEQALVDTDARMIRHREVASAA